LDNALELIINSMSFKTGWHMTTVHPINTALNVSVRTCQREVKYANGIPEQRTKTSESVHLLPAGDMAQGDKSASTVQVLFVEIIVQFSRAPETPM